MCVCVRVSRSSVMRFSFNVAILILNDHVVTGPATERVKILVAFAISPCSDIPHTDLGSRRLWAKETNRLFFVVGGGDTRVRPRHTSQSLSVSWPGYARPELQRPTAETRAASSTARRAWFAPKVARALDPTWVLTTQLTQTRRPSPRTTQRIIHQTQKTNRVSPISTLRMGSAPTTTRPISPPKYPRFRPPKRVMSRSTTVVKNPTAGPAALA